MHRDRKAFTLIELFVVLTLMSVAVGMAVFSLDGLSEAARLRSSAAQIGSLLSLARIQAQATGTPRILQYAAGRDRVVIRKPLEQTGGWIWDTGLEFLLGTDVHIRNVLAEGLDEKGSEDEGRAVRIGADGGYRAHAVILETHNRFAAAVLDVSEDPRCVLLPRAPLAATFESLIMELENAKHTP